MAFWEVAWGLGEWDAAAGLGTAPSGARGGDGTGAVPFPYSGDPSQPQRGQCLTVGLSPVGPWGARHRCGGLRSPSCCVPAPSAEVPCGAGRRPLLAVGWHSSSGLGRGGWHGEGSVGDGGKGGVVAWHLGSLPAPRGLHRGPFRPSCDEVPGRWPRPWGLPWGLAVLMPLSHRTPSIGEWNQGQHLLLPWLPPAPHWCSLGDCGLPACFVAFLSCFPGGVTSPSVPGDGGVGGGPVLLCTVLLSSLFFLSLARGRMAPSWLPHGEGGSIKRMAGDACCPCTAWPLCCLLSVVCVARQVRGHHGEGQVPLIPLMPLCTGLSPAVLSMGRYFLPQGRKPLPRKTPFQAALQPGESCRTVISPPPEPRASPTAEKPWLELCKTLP